MMDLFYAGNSIFMGTLTLLLLVVVAMAVYRGIQISRNDIRHETSFRHRLTHIKGMGVFTLVLGIFCQLLGLYQAFSVIERMGNASPAILAGGLKVSMITTLYGIIIFLISYILWFALDYMAKSRAASA